MKDLSFFLLKNSLGAKMRKGFRSTFCNDDGSTSTLDQKNSMASPYTDPPHHHRNKNPNNIATERSFPATTLEDMILKLELEEEKARKAKLEDYTSNGKLMRGRMSCVNNNSDILMSARNALNQYPRFSLDGKDAMYRSSFRNSTSTTEGRRSICCEYGLRRRRVLDNECNLCLPPTLAGESVVWCKPGVVAKLMGLEAVPVPTNGREKKHDNTTLKRRNLRRRAARHELERRLVIGHVNNTGNDINHRGMFIDRDQILASSSTISNNKTAPTDYSILNPGRGSGGGAVVAGRPTQRFT